MTSSNTSYKLLIICDVESTMFSCKRLEGSINRAVPELNSVTVDYNEYHDNFIYIKYYPDSNSLVIKGSMNKLESNGKNIISYSKAIRLSKKCSDDYIIEWLAVQIADAKRDHSLQPKTESYNVF